MLTEAKLYDAGKHHLSTAIVLSVSAIGAAGSFGIDFGMDVNVLASKVQGTLAPWISAKAWGEGKATIVGMGGGLKVEGWLLKNSFPLTVIYDYHQYPILIT